MVWYFRKYTWNTQLQSIHDVNLNKLLLNVWDDAKLQIVAEAKRFGPGSVHNDAKNELIEKGLQKVNSLAWQSLQPTEWPETSLL